MIARSGFNRPLGSLPFCTSVLSSRLPIIRPKANPYPIQIEKMPCELTNFTFWMKASCRSPLTFARTTNTTLITKKPAAVAIIHCCVTVSISERNPNRFSACLLPK